MLYLDTKLTISEARKLGISVKILDRENNLIALRKRKIERIFKATRPPQNNVISFLLCSNKEFTIQILKRANLPVPEGMVFTDLKKALQFSKKVVLPVVVKGTRGAGGKNVLANLKTRSAVDKALREIFGRSETVMIEKMVPGDDYRILVIKGKAVACVKRIPANVIGNGKNNLKELINKENGRPERGKIYTKPLVKIEINSDTKQVLRSQGLTLKSVPPVGKTIYLKSTANLSAGGVVEDYTSRMNPEYAQIAVRASEALGNMAIVGLDIISTDITKPIKKSGGVIIEANDAPMLQLHQLPTIGNPINVCKMFVKLVIGPLK
jgi:cyanophycin synthetase